MSKFEAIINLTLVIVIYIWGGWNLFNLLRQIFHR